MDPPSQLDTDIAAIRAQISLLRHRRKNLSSVLLSSPSITTRLQRASHSTKPPPPSLARALTVLSKQARHNQTALHRICAGATAYRVRDPDPHAVDEGRILGIQIEVFVNRAFIPPYHLLLHRPSPASPALKIHHHTIPPCIPLAPLAAAHLPQPSAAGGDPARPAQNLPRLVRALRRELVAYHLRLAAVEKLRVVAGVPSQATEKEGELGDVLNAGGEMEMGRGGRRKRGQGRGSVVAVVADAAVREARCEWSSGLTARMKVSKDGVVEKVVVRTAEGGRDWEVEKKGKGHLGGLFGRLGQEGRRGES